MRTPTMQRSHIPPKIAIARLPNGIWVGVGSLPAGHGGPLTVMEIVDERPIARRAMSELLASGQVETTEIGFLSGLWKGIKKTVRKIARSKIIRKIGKTVSRAMKTIRKVVDHPVTQQVMQIVGQTSPVGAAIATGYGALRGGLVVVDGLTKGNPAALEQAAGIAAKAAGGHAGARQAVTVMKTAAAIRSGKPMQAIQQALPNIPIPGLQRDQVKKQLKGLGFWGMLRALGVR